MKVILLPPEMRCVECGNTCYVSRVKPEHTDVVVTCLSQHCKERDVGHLFPLSIVELMPMPANGEPT
jgi:hypothetical protein